MVLRAARMVRVPRTLRALAAEAPEGKFTLTFTAPHQVSRAGAELQEISTSNLMPNVFYGEVRALDLCVFRAVGRFEFTDAIRRHARIPSREIRLASISLMLVNQALYAAKPVTQVNVPSSSGDFGILPHHVPIISTLTPGVVNVFESAEVQKKYFGM